MSTFQLKDIPLKSFVFDEMFRENVIGRKNQFVDRSVIDFKLAANTELLIMGSGSGTRHKSGEFP